MLSLEKSSELCRELGINVNFQPSEARLRNKAGRMFFTLKGSGGLSRNEFEVKIDQNTFDKFWTETEGKRVEKVRLNRQFEEYTIEFDVYLDRDLIVAEIEVQTIEEISRLKPVGKDVTGEGKYRNINLVK